jgi:DNA replication and repair protein RecF
VLEAAYVLATTRSFRTSQIADCVRHGAEGFHLEGEVETDRRASLEVGWQAGQRSRSVNGKATSLSEHLGVLPVVAWTAAEAQVLVGPPSVRRRFLDRGLVGLRPSALEVLGRYREALRHKRGLLATGEAGLEIWNEMLASFAAEVIESRHGYVERLKGELATVVAGSGLPFPPVDLRYRPSPSNGLEGREAVEASLEKAAGRERRRGLPLLGPHRDDLEVLWGGHEVRRVASAGERKALSLLLLAAHGRVVESAGREPLYLLDDADAELSPATHATAWKVFGGARQVVATSNRPQVWLTLDVGTVWEMEKGRIQALS